jgi:uncharacterized membrane protein YeaQ/YmgE (transglycosylase-associated protein family)
VSLMGILTTIIIGGVVGWIAGILMKTRGQMGVLADIVVGIVGSMIGTFLFGLLGFAAYGFIAALIVDVAGAAILIAILKGLKVYR